MKPSEELWMQVEKAAGAFRDFSPQAGMILHTGPLEILENAKEWSGAQIEGLPACYQKKKFRLGTIAGRETIVLENPPRLSEGVSQMEAAFPVWLFQRLGVKALILTAAAGALHPKFKVGSLMLVEDHLNWTGSNPLIGVQEERLGPLFPDLTLTYQREWIAQTLKLAKKMEIPARSGVLAATTGPGLETLAEKKFLRVSGADALANSMVPEAIAACHAGLPVLALAAVTDQALGQGKANLSIEKMLAAAESAIPRLEKLLARFIETQLS